MSGSPKMRFQIGQFFRAKRSVRNFINKNELVCLTLAYRLKSAPNIWIYRAEVRENLSDPSTGLSIMCAEVTGGPKSNRIISEPVRSSRDFWGLNSPTSNDYHFGDYIDLTTKELLNDFIFVSSGEVK